MTPRRILLILSTAILVAACGPEAPDKKLQDAAERVQEAKSDVRSASDDVSSATDAGIFRLIQTALLDDPDLQDTVVYASVVDGSVSLYGDVSTREQKVRAEDIARKTPGVSHIRNLIDIDSETGQES